MTKSTFIAALLLTVFAVGYAGNAEAQFWKRKKHTHKSKSHKKKTAEIADGEGNEEDMRTADGNATTHELTKKERKELKKKEKKERKEKERIAKKEKEDREKREKKEKKELAAKDKKAKSKKAGKKGKKSPAPANEPVMVVKKWSDIEYAPSQRKTHYRIDILAPLYLDELVKNGYAVKDIPEKAVPGLNFYKGVQIAADSLKKANFDIDIYVHDVASLLESTDMLVRKNMLDSSDLIIGAVPSKDVPTLAGYAKSKQVNFISALSPADGGIRDNQYFTLLQPSLKSHCEWITDDVEKKYTGKKMLLMYRSFPPAELNAYNYLTNDTANRRLFNPLLCNTLPKKENIAVMIDTSKINTVVISILDNTYADSLLRILKRDFPNVRFEVYGMPSWASMASIGKPGNYPNLSINVTVPFNFDPANPSLQYIDKMFKKDYGGKPQEMVYRGYETMFWYANMLMRHGTIFNKQYNDNEIAPFTRFEVAPQWDNAGNVLYMENKHIFVHKYESAGFNAHK